MHRQSANACSEVLHIVHPCMENDLRGPLHLGKPSVGLGMLKVFRVSVSRGKAFLGNGKPTTHTWTVCSTRLAQK